MRHDRAVLLLASAIVWSALPAGAAGAAGQDAGKSPAVKGVVVEPRAGRFEEGDVALTVDVEAGAVVVPAGPGNGGETRLNGGRLRRVVPLNAARLENWQKKYVEALGKSNKVLDTSATEQFVERTKPAAPPEPTAIESGKETALVEYQGLPTLPGELEEKIISHSLMITDLKVVEDPSRTTGAGRWTFGRLMTELANPQETGISPSDFVKGWLKHWQVDVTINGFTAPARKEGIERLTLGHWPRVPGTDDLDLEKAPFRLLAIASRLDLRSNLVLGVERVGEGNAGEARFIFCAVDEDGAPLAFTVIFEYGVKKANYDEVRQWASDWYDLSKKELGSADYNEALQRLTDEFSSAGVDPESPPNRSGLAQLRTNEIALVVDPRVKPTPRRAAQVWEIREFRIDANNTGELVQVTVKQTPDLTFNDPANFGSQQLLAQYINEQTPQILYKRHRVPPRFPNDATREPFLGASSITPANVFWDAPGVSEPEARHLFSLFTCSGCHGAETFPKVPPFDDLAEADRVPPHFTHVRPRQAGHVATLSPFLTGVGADGGAYRLPDPSGQKDPADPSRVLTREFHDLRDRAADLHGIVEFGTYYEVWRAPRQRVH